MESWTSSYVSQNTNHTHTLSPPKNSILNTFSIDNQLSEQMGFSQMLGKPTSSKLSNWDSLIDLNLGRFGSDHVHGNGNAIDVAFSKGPTFLSSSESSTPTKRLKASGESQIAYCQVYGCNKDLSSCKDYHKRHKVCEVHSKTPTVIVNGIQQRFCQQCSRFHLLGEFDDGKRSCRKRLAGHNERRRKPQVGICTGKSRRSLQPCGDSISNGTKLPAASFVFPEVFPNGVMHSDKHGTSGFWRPMKAEHGASFRTLSSLPVANGCPQSRSLIPSLNEKQFPFLHESSATSTTGSIFCESNNHYSHAIAAQNSGLRPLFQNESLGSDEDFNVFHRTSNIQELSGISDSCALSLLSSQSQNTSSQSSGIPLAPSLVIPSSHFSISKISERIGMNSQTSPSQMSDKFPSELNSADGNGSHLSDIFISDNNDIANFEAADGIFQDSDFVNVEDRLSGEDGATIDLLQLSLQLQRVEHQRRSSQVTKESDSSRNLQIT